MANCPTCTTRHLSPTLLASGLSAKSCFSCNGALVDLLSYRAWADQAGIDAVSSTEFDEHEVADTNQAITCPNCSSVMNKYSLSSKTSNQLDFCMHCDLVWLDAGEWEQLNNLGLRKSMGTVFTEPWQRRIRSDRIADAREENLRERFGGDYERLKEFRTWIQQHPQYESAMAWLYEVDD